MMNYKSLLLVLMLMGSVALFGWSITDTYFGDNFGTMDARSYGMGGTGTYNEVNPFGIADNPANLTLMRKSLGFGVNTYFNRNEDNRSIPLYNSFDNYIDDAVYSSNINVYNNLAGALFGVYHYDNAYLGLGVFHRPMLSFDAGYVEEVRNNRNTDDDLYPEKIAENSIEGEGTLDQTGFVFSMGPKLGDYTGFNLGVEFSILNGDVVQEKSIKWTDWAIDAVHAVGNFNLPELNERDDYELNGNQIKLGATAELGPRFGVALTYVPKTILTKEGSYYYKRDAYLNTAMDSTNVEYKGNYTLAPKMRVGFVYHPRNVMRTNFNLDLEYVQHSEINKMIDDVVNLYAGVEHHINNRMPLRLGFQAVNNWFFTAVQDVDENNMPVTVYTSRKVLTPMMTAGSSVVLSRNFTLDLGFGYTWREYEAKDLFGDAYYNDKIYTGAGASADYALWPNYHLNLQNRGWENPDKVRENNISLNAGLSFVW